MISTTIDSGGVQYVSYELGTGTAIGTTISGGAEYVSSGGTATDTIVYSGGVADILSGGVANAPVIDGGTLELAAGAKIGSGGIEFAAVSGTLDLAGEGSGLTFTPVIAGFTGTAASSDIIEVAGSGATDHVVWTQDGGSGTLLVETPSNNVLETLTLEGTYYQQQFVLTESGSDDEIAYDTFLPCYRRGTAIATEHGEVAVEALKVGERVMTASGALRPIRWIGVRPLDVRKHPSPEDVWPVRVRAGAFGEGSPRRDLWLSRDHAIASEGTLIPISALINGHSVAQVRTDRVEYFHVELDRHDVMFAEGLPAESYLDCGYRCAFANGGAYVEAHPDFRPKTLAETCLPLVKEGPSVVAARTRLVREMLEAGYQRNREADPHIRADGKRYDPVRLGDARLAFALPTGCKTILLKSNTFVPASLDAESVDTRELGLDVSRLQVDGDDVALERDEPRPSGWSWAEFAEGTFAHRWTTGAAALPAGARFVIVDLGGRGEYWRSPYANVVALFA